MVEIARTVFEPLGYKVVYTTMPWSKALKDTETGMFTAVVGAAHEDCENFVFPGEWQGATELAYYVRSDNPWKFAGIPSLDGKKLGVILDYSYSEEIDKYLEGNPNALWAIGDLPLQKNFASLKKGDLDVVLSTKTVGDYILSEMKLTDDIMVAGSDGELDGVYIAFSPANPKSKDYAKMLDEGMKRIREDGTLARILKKYGVKDWK